MNKRSLFYFNIIYLKINDQSTTKKNQIKRFKQIKWKTRFGHYSDKNGSTVRALGKPEPLVVPLLPMLTRDPESGLPRCPD